MFLYPAHEHSHKNFNGKLKCTTTVSELEITTEENCTHLLKQPTALRSLFFFF